MSIVKPCPYDINGEHCKYEIYYGEPIFSKCKNCSRTRTIFKRCIEMTNEEMAEEYVDTLLDKDDYELDKFLDENLGDLKLNKKQAGTLLGIIKGVGICSYLAGLKAGRPEWHKVADGDLPKKVGDYITNIGVLTYDNYGNGVHKWHTPYCEACDYTDEADDDEVIAWCEIPKFDDKE